MFNLTSDETGNLIYLIVLLGFIASGILFRRKIKTSEILKQLFWWLLIILIIVFLYSFRHDFDNAKNRLKSELFPSSAIQISDNQISINVSQGGHFYINLKVNGEDVRFMVDTGASDTVLTQDDAKKVGINLDNLSYSKIYETANGKVFAASIKLDKCPHCGRLGEIITKRPRRTGGLLKVKGLLINPDLISEFLSSIQLINEFQIIIRKENLSDVDSLDLLVIKLDAFETNHDYLVGFLANEIKKIVMIKPVIEFASLGEIYDPMKNMKIKRVLDLRI